MTTTLIVRRDAVRARQAQALIETSREIKVLDVTESLYRAQAALDRLDPDTLLLDLRLEDGAALSLVRWLRERPGGRPKIMLVAPDAAEPLLFATLAAGADAYLPESELTLAAAAIERLVAGEAAMAAPLATMVLQFFNEPLQPVPRRGLLADDRQLDWQSHAGNPMRLSPGEVRLLQWLAQGSRIGEVAARVGQSIEAVGRRIAHIYRKLGWDVHRGSLSLLAA